MSILPTTRVLRVLSSRGILFTSGNVLLRQFFAARTGKFVPGRTMSTFHRDDVNLIRSRHSEYYDGRCHYGPQKDLRQIEEEVVVTESERLAGVFKLIEELKALQMAELNELRVMVEERNSIIAAIQSQSKEREVEIAVLTAEMDEATPMIERHENLFDTTMRNVVVPVQDMILLDNNYRRLVASNCFGHMPTKRRIMEHLKACRFHPVASSNIEAFIALLGRYLNRGKHDPDYNFLEEDIDRTIQFRTEGDAGLTQIMLSRLMSGTNRSTDSRGLDTGANKDDNQAFKVTIR